MKDAAGHVLLLALLVLVVAFAAVALVAAEVIQRQALARATAQDVHLTALTDAGLATALAELARQPTYDGAPPETLGPGSFEIEVRQPAPGRAEVEVTARYGGAGRRIEAEVELRPGRPPQVVAWRPLGGLTGGGDSTSMREDP